MIYISDLYNLFLNQIRTDARGLSFSPDQFNLLISPVNNEVYDDYLEGFEENIDNIDDLAYFKVHNYSIALAAVGGVMTGILPVNYYRMIGKPRIVDSGSITRPVDIVTTYEDAVREDDYLTKASETHPTCTIGGVDANLRTRIRVRPATITTIYIDYMRAFLTGGEPAIPYLDYYTNDTTKVITFLAETSTAQSIPAGYTYRDGTVGGAAVTVTSRTKNLVWGVSDIPLLIGKLIKHAGYQLPDEGLVQAGIAEEIKKS